MAAIVPLPVVAIFVSCFFLGGYVTKMNVLSISPRRIESGWNFHVLKREGKISIRTDKSRNRTCYRFKTSDLLIPIIIKINIDILNSIAVLWSTSRTVNV
jgi:hypothetical protein